MTNEVNQEKFAKVIEFLKKIVVINEQTPFCADFDLMGNWNQVEIRLYPTKEVPATESILFLTLDLQGEHYDDADKIELIETELNNALKSHSIL